MRPPLQPHLVLWGNAAHSEVDRCERIFGDDHELEVASNKVRIFGTPQGLGIINQTAKSKTVVCARFGLKESAKKKVSM